MVGKSSWSIIKADECRALVESLVGLVIMGLILFIATDLAPLFSIH